MEIRRASLCDRQCVREWRWRRIEQKGEEEPKARRGKKNKEAKRRNNSIKSSTMKEKKRKAEWKRVAPNTKLNPDQGKLS